MKLGLLAKRVAATLVAAVGFAGIANAQLQDDGLLGQASKSMKGKTVAYVPIAMGFDLTEAWASGLKHDAAELGYKLIIRDPNWSVDAGAQAITQLISEKPDVLVVHPPEIQAYSRLLQRAAAAGISVVTMSLKSETNGDVFIGAEWYGMAVQQAESMAKLCGKGSGKSGKVAVMQGVLTNPTSRYGIQAIQDTFKKYPELKIVSNQAADWDASKAHAVAATVLKANPDLCGFIGFWDNMDVGTAAAIKEAGKTGQVYLVTSGGGNQASACSNISNGNFTTYISYDAKGQARDLMMAVRGLLQQKPAKPGEKTVGLYTPLRTITKDTLYNGACWNLDDVKKYGP